MRAATPLTMFVCLLCLCPPLLPVGAQTPNELPAPLPSAAVQILLNDVNKSLKEQKLEEALKTAEQALTTAQMAYDTVGEARAFRAKALVLTRLNRLPDAVTAWKEAASAWERAGDGPGQVEGLRQAGALLIKMQSEEATSLFDRALLLGKQEIKRPLTAAAQLNDAGATLYSSGKLNQAHVFFAAAMAIYGNLAPNSLNLASSLNNLGSVANEQGDLTAATDYYKRALAIKEKLAPNSLVVAISLNNLGSVAYEQGDIATAEVYHKRALAICEKLAPNSLYAAASLNNLGLVAEAKGDFVTAVTKAQQAWNIVRQQAQSVSGDEARQAFGEANSSYAERLLQYQIATKKPEAVQHAFVTLEQGRAQALQQLLVERHAFAGAKNSPLWNVYEQATRDRDRALATSSYADVRQSRADRALAEAKEPGVNTTSAEMTRLETALKEANARFDTAQAAYTQARLKAEGAWKQIKAANPRTFVPERSVSELQQALPPTTLFVAFSVDDEQSHVFLARSTGAVQAFVLPVKAKELTQQIADLRADLTDSHSDAARLNAKSHRLFALLFPPPAQKEIAGSSRLLISPDGPLWNLPFGALVVGNATGGKNGKTSTPDYLGAQKPLCYTQSLSVFAQTRQDKRSLLRGQKPTALVLGDPVFTPAAQVVVASNTPSTSRGNDSDRALHGERGYLWDKSAPPHRLEKTKEEAHAIAKLYSATPLLGEQATEAELRKNIEQADILHLATHGYFHPKIAMASGLLLTPPAIEPPIGETNNDGALQAWEIFSQLHLRAELAVLSACETGLGRNVTGEGVIGLTRALQYAGCRSIVASQWQVNDASTATLMKKLHENLRAGLSKDEALRQAMATVRGNAKTSHPYYWAAFFLTGDPDNANLAAPTAIKQAKK